MFRDIYPCECEQLQFRHEQPPPLTIVGVLMKSTERSPKFLADTFG